MSKIFISHSVADKPLVDEIINLLESGIGVPQNDIFCVSQPGQNVPTGKDFKTHIRDVLDGAQLVIALITQNYYNSAFCMCELGGVWIQSKAIIPLIAPPFGFADLKAVLAGVQALKINNGTDLDTMRDDVTAIYDAKALSKTSRWTIRKDKFLEKLEAVIAQLPDNNPIEKLEHEKVLSKLHDYKVEVDEQQAEIDVLKEKIGRLMLVKDATQAADVIAEYTDAHSRFEDLLSECKQAFKPFSTLILKTIFESFNGKDYIPKSGDEWDEAREGINEGLLIENSEDNGVKPNESDTDILEAIEKLGYLRQFLSEGDEEFSAWYSNTFKGVTDNIRVKPFWRKHLVDDRAF